jgi:hypothetical protein
VVHVNLLKLLLLYKNEKRKKKKEKKTYQGARDTSDASRAPFVVLGATEVVVPRRRRCALSLLYPSLSLHVEVEDTSI